MRAQSYDSVHISHDCSFWLYKLFLANRRAEVIDWLGGLLPEFDLPLDSSDEELREFLIDGTALCYIAEKLMPDVQEVSSVISEMLNF